METVQIKIDPCPDHFDSRTRNRKIAFDHGRRVDMADINGNHGNRMYSRRKSSCESSGLLSGHRVRKNSISNLEAMADIPDWQKSLLKQIETLVVNSNQNDSAMPDIESELAVIDEGVIPQNSAEERHRSRRKSNVHHGSDFLHPNWKISRSNRDNGNFSGHTSQSVANRGHLLNPNASNGRRKSYANIERYANNGRRKSYANIERYANNGRRKSYANIEHHIARSKRSGSVGNLKDSLPVRGRLNSVCHRGLIQFPQIRQRRKSSVKPPTFTVSKITSVQRKSYYIYRRRRRKELRHVEQFMTPSITVEKSDDSSNDNDNNDDAVQDIDEPVDNDINDVATDEVDSNTPNTEEDAQNCNVTVEEQIPAPRRKCSIQMRYFEISRKLRQRRRQRKPDSLNNDVDIDKTPQNEKTDTDFE